MYPASARFKAAILTDHIAIAKAEVWNATTKLVDLPIESGSVDISTNSTSRRTCNVQLVQSRETDNLVPDTGFDVLTPYGNEIRVYRGIRFSDGTEEYIPLGVFPMTDIDIIDTANGISINIRGEDRSLFISRAKWLQPYQMSSGSLESSIRDLLVDRYPDIQTNFPTTNVTINKVILGADNDKDPWRSAVELCELVGYDLYFDVNGVATMRQFPVIDGSVPVASYIEGQNTRLTELQRNISSKETYSGIVYTLEGSQVSSPIRVEVWDEDSTSPTYIYGVFGKAPKFITSNLVQTNVEARTAAYALLNKYIGAQESVSWDAIVDPTLDANDVIYIKTTGSKVRRLIIIDDLSIPLSSTDTMTGTARTVRIVADNEIVNIPTDQLAGA